MTKRRVLIAAYRDWAIESFNRIGQITAGQVDLSIVSSNDQLVTRLKMGDVDLVILIGWSWLVRSDLVSTVPIFGVHPSDLPAYAGGSPIQHQILDGVTDTMSSLFLVTEKIDAGAVIHKVALSLRGSMAEVLQRLSDTAVVLSVNLIGKDPASLSSWVANARAMPIAERAERPRRRLTPESGRLFKDKLLSMTTVELYNFIRCREWPYPNAYIQDEFGVLKFGQVSFEPKDRGLTDSTRVDSPLSREA